MTNRTSLFVALLVLAAVWVDTQFGWGASMFLMRKIDGLIEWLAFWR